MDPSPSVHHLPLSRPPVPATHYGGCGTSLHGRRGDEPYCNRFWVLNIISGPGGILRMGNEEIPFSDNTALVVPPGVPHGYRFHAPTRKHWIHFQPDPRAEVAPVPIAQDVGARASWFRETIVGAIPLAAAEPARMTAVMWDLLFHLTSGPIGGVTPLHHPAIRALRTHVAQHLATPMDPAGLAQATGCSTTHLNRLCRAAVGMSIAAYVRHLRLQRAVELLRDTERSVSDIAAAVGYPDLHHFNKLVRAHAGASPRHLRGR